jgi:hypothetical protein
MTVDQTHNVKRNRAGHSPCGKEIRGQTVSIPGGQKGDRPEDTRARYRTNS